MSNLFCNFDWAVFWTAAQAWGIWLAFGAAYLQLLAFRRTEATKATMKMLSDFDDPKAQIYKAYKRLVSIERPADYIAANRKKLNASDQTFIDEAIIVSNYFDYAAVQIASGIMDVSVYLSEMDEITVAAYACLNDALVEIPGIHPEEFQWLASICSAHYERSTVEKNDFLLSYDISTSAQARPGWKSLMDRIAFAMLKRAR